MARILNDASLPFRFATPALAAGDDEIGLHAEALADGREPIALELEQRDLLPDDEIDAHLEAGELLFAPLRVRPVRRRRATRH